MDYDDNDFQSQNLHLAGEGSTNCPPVLQPYGLPKFDFDDSLQGHLRFDSLVETEVFLGIESSEANNWIEDFSRGSSGIEFSSGAVESCSISRRNNVWSEATSSESVEMLLKSVGQEEIIPAHTIFEESDAGKEVGCIKQMEPNLKNDDNILSEIGAVTDLQSTLLPDEITGNLSVLEDVGDQPQLEDSSQTQEVELPVDGNASVLDPNSVSDQDRLHVSKGSLFADEKCNDANTMEFDNLVDVPPDEKPHKDSSASEMQVDNMLTSVQNIITSSDELNNQDAPRNMMETSERNPGSHVVSIDIRCRNEKAVEQATCHLEKPHYFVSEAKSVEKENANEDSALDVQEAGNMIPQGDSNLHTVGGCRDGDCPGVVAETNKCEDMVVFKETAVGGNQSKSNTHELSPTYKNDTGYANELMNSLAGNSSDLDPILKGDSDLHSVDRCSDRESPEVLDETNKYEDVKHTDSGGYQSKSNTDELSQMAYRSESGFEYSNSNAGLLSSLDPILKGDSDLHTVDVCSNKECPEVPAETNKCEHMVLVKDTDIGGDQSKVCTHDLSPMTYRSDTGNAVDSGSSSVNPILRTDNDLPMVDGCSERKCPDVAAETTKCEVKGTDTGGDQSNVSPHDSLPVAYRSDTGYADEVRNSNSEISSSLDPRVKMTSGKSTNEDAIESGGQPDIEIFDRTSEAPVSVIEEIEVLKGGSDENWEVHSNLTATGSSAEMISEVHVTGASKSPHDGLGVSAEELNADNRASPSILGESSQTCNENEVYEEGKSGECDQDLSHSEKDSTKFPSESNSIVLEVDGSVGKGVGSSSFCEDTTEKELIVPTLKHEVDGNASVADAPSESCNLASCGTIDAVPVSSESGATSDIHNLSVVQAAPSPAVGSHSDNKEETAIKISKDANLSCTVSPPMVEVETVPGPVCKAEKGASCEPAGQLFCKKLDQSLPISVSCNTESHREPGTAVADEISKRSTTDNSVQCEFSVKKVDDAEVHDGATTENKSTAEDKSEKASAGITEPNMNCDGNVTQLVPSSLVLMCDSTGKKALEDSGTTEVSGHKTCAEAVVPNINRDAFRKFEAPLPETHVKFGALESGERSTDPNQPDCGSPKVFGTIETSEAKHVKGNIKGLTNQTAPDSNVVGDGGKHSSNSSNPTGNDLSNDKRYGTSDVSSFADFPKGNDANSSQAFPALPAFKIVEGSQTNSGSAQMDANISQEISHGGPKVSDGEIATGGSKGTTERKRRRAPSKGLGKESAKKGTVKATTPMRQAERGDKSSSVSLTKSGIFQFAQPSEIQYYGLVDSSSKTYSILTSSTSTLPDLNSSAPPSLVFQQPFTDLQQVQLRAQIFVYGALIQGTAPEEAYMVSAFGGPEGGRSIWENSWRVCIERLHSQKSTPINPETPLQSSSDVRFTGARVPDQVVKQSAFQGKAIPSPVGRASTKGILPTASPMIPISSPLWSIPTPAREDPQYSVVPRGSAMEYQQAHTALHSFQTSPIRNIVGHNASWMSQSSFRGPWVASPQSSAAEASIHFSAFPSTESVLLTPVKETTVPQVSSIKHAPSGLAGQTGGTTSVFAGASPLLDPKKVAAASPGEPSSQSRSRKRKKISDSKELGNITLQPQSQPESALTRAVTSSVSTSVAVTTPITFVPKAMPEKFVMSVSSMASSDHLKKADLGLEQKATLSEETLSKAKEARQQAEEASAHAAAAVSHSQEIWNQLDKQKNSRLISDSEAKLASAAVAVAAAAAVAKAAAAAANVASNAALQAILMAEEAYGNPSESMRNFGTDGVNALGLATPASVFRVEDGTNSSSSILVAAREAARRRVEAASAASKRAENMDAIVKAAELAAEAVSQAGTVVAMGDPLPLSELVKAGPEGYWKVPKVSSEMVKKSSDRMREQSNLYTLGEDSDTSARQLEERRSEKKETQITEHKKLPTVGEKVTETIESASPTAEKDFEETAHASKDSSILEGSQVEVFKDGGGFGVGWFTASVLSLLDGNAYVCYTELQSDEGSEKLQEWVSLDGKEDKPPKIRVARLLTPSLEGTRKRRREAMADYTWSVGDKVDAWIQNSWWEGVVTEKNKKDETILKVHFPAQGETSHVKAWHLRPSLIWKDGEWVEWSSVRNDCSSMEDGMPQEKRIKLGSPTVEGKGKEKTLKSNVVDSGKPEEPRLLSLSANEKVFNIGKNTRTENKPDAARTNRTGLQKEGSVKFGIPKPKRKFMDVSKHYVSNQSNKVNEANDSVKFAKYLMPQASGFRALKNTSKIDTKDKEVAESKLKGLKSEKQRSMLDKTVPQKDNLLTDLVSAPDGSSKMDHTRKIRDSVRHAEGLSGKRNILETGSSYSSDGRAQGPVTFSSRTPSDFPFSKKVSSSTAKSERGNKGNFAPAGGKLGKIEEDKGTSSNPANSTSEVVEPRRSNRRIQPTSRLLEGLQSSLSISKIPSVSHDKGARSQNRNASRG